MSKIIFYYNRLYDGVKEVVINENHVYEGMPDGVTGNFTVGEC